MKHCEGGDRNKRRRVKWKLTTGTFFVRGLWTVSERVAEREGEMWVLEGETQEI